MRPTSMLLHGSATTGDEPVDQQNNDGADDGAYQAGALSRPIPPERLSKPGRNEGAHDAQYRGQDKPGRLVVTRHNELGGYTCDKANDDGPQNAHDRTFALALSVAG